MEQFKTLISGRDLEAILSQDNLRIFDARFNLKDPEEGRRLFTRSHIPGSQYVDLDNDLSGPIMAGTTGRHPLPDKTQFLTKLRQWGVSQDNQLVIYDQSHGGIAARMWWLCQWLGHERVAVLDGGWQDWVDSDRQTTAKVTSYPLGDFVEKTTTCQIVDADEVATTISSERAVIIDARAEARYLGREEPLDPVAGHIPTALNRPFLANLDEHGRWKDSRALKREWKQLLGTEDAKSIICYCGSGVTACHNILATRHAGLSMPALYAGSWSEWITNPARPIAKDAMTMN